MKKNIQNSSKVHGENSLETRAKRIQCLGINLTKEVKNLYAKLCKSLLREIKGDTNKSEDNPGSLIGRLDIVKVLKYDIQVTNNHTKKFKIFNY